MIPLPILGKGIFKRKVYEEMTAERFSKIFDALLERKNKCDEILGSLFENPDISDRTIKEIVAIKEFCEAELPIMTNIAMCDLYHIIGMSDITPIQTMQFIKVFKEYIRYRVIVKLFTDKEFYIDEVPKLPKKSRYRMLELGNVEVAVIFSNGLGDTLDVANLEEYDILKKNKHPDEPNPSPKPTLPFVLDGYSVIIKRSDIEKFTLLINEIMHMDASIPNAVSKITNLKDCLGFSWKKEEKFPDSFRGRFKSKDVHEKLLNFIAIVEKQG